MADTLRQRESEKNQTFPNFLCLFLHFMSKYTCMGPLDTTPPLVPTLRTINHKTPNFPHMVSLISFQHLESEFEVVGKERKNKAVRNA